MKPNPPQTIDDYIAAFPKDIQAILETIRKTIQEAAPDATEKINYGIPTFELHGNLVHFAAFKHHIGFYPAPSGIEKFKIELSVYKGAKGSVQFPLDKPMPLALIAKIVKYRAKENIAKATRKLQSFPKISQPALRALNRAGYKGLEQLSKVSEADLRNLHGMGPKALEKLKAALRAKGLSLKP